MSSPRSISVTPITTESSVRQGFDITVRCFCHQTYDGVFVAMNPGWDTLEGHEAGAQRFVDRWRSTRSKGNNTVFLQGTLPVNGEEKVVGFAIWQQLSMITGSGDEPSDVDAAAIYPDNEAEQKYVLSLDRSLHKRRRGMVEEKAKPPASPPAVFVLDLCVVHPEYQRRGVANALVQWGLDEAKRRGGLECVTEASAMGRHVYEKLGFHQEGGEVEYDVAEEFKSRLLPSNIFMRTGGG